MAGAVIAATLVLGAGVGLKSEEYLRYFDTGGASTGPTEATNLLRAIHVTGVGWAAASSSRGPAPHGTRWQCCRMVLNRGGLAGHPGSPSCTVQRRAKLPSQDALKPTGSWRIADEHYSGYMYSPEPAYREAAPDIG